MNRSLLSPRGLPSRSLLSAAALLSLACAAEAQTLVQPISPTAGLPTITYAFNHTSPVTIVGTNYNANYYDFTITGFTNVGAGNPTYDIYSFENSTLEKEPGVVAVLSSYLPSGWTFTDTHDFDISTTPDSAIHADDPAFGLIFIQTVGSAAIVPNTPFTVYHQDSGVDQFVLPDGKTPVLVTPTPAVPEASTTVSFGLLLALGLGAAVLAARRRKANSAG